MEFANFASFYDMHPSGKEHLLKGNKPERRRKAPNTWFASHFVNPDISYFANSGNDVWKA